MRITISKVPGDFYDVSLERGATAQDAARQASIDTSGYEFRVNGVPSNANTVLNEGDTVLLTKMVKGNN